MDMEEESYNPAAIYGSLTEEQKSLVAATVAQRKRKARTWFSGFVPVYTTDVLDPFVVLATHLPRWIRAFGNRNMYVSDGMSQALDVLLSVTPGEVSMVDGNLFSLLLRDKVPQLMLNFLSRNAQIPVNAQIEDVEGRPVAGFTLRRLSATQYRYCTVIKTPTGPMRVYRPDMSTVFQLYVAGRVLDRGLLRQWSSIALDGAEVLYSDWLVRRLPQPTLAELTRRLEIRRPQRTNNPQNNRNNRPQSDNTPPSSQRPGRKVPSRATKAEAQAKQKADAKKKAKRKAQVRTKAKRKEAENTHSSSSEDEPLPTRFARPPNLLPSEVLKMIDMHEKNDYHDVCPEDVADYVHLMKWQPGDNMQQLRAKRNRALGCAVLRQRKKQEHVRRGTHTAGHEYPISRAYALATGASSQIVAKPGASASNILLDRWLPTRQSLIANSNRVLM